MQTLSPTIFPCYAAAERAVAAAIADFLERGANGRVFLEEGEMQPGEDLISKAREGRVAEIVLVLFSRGSLPPRWQRAQWEDALQKEPADENVRIAFVRCDDCAPPRVLVPQFDLSVRRTEGLRRLKRWVRTGLSLPLETPLRPDLATDVELLGLAIADRAGMQTVDNADVAAEFVHVFRDDFDEVLRLECGDRSLAAITGDLASQLELRLEGDTESNLARLRDFCAERRFLLWLESDGPSARHLVLGGRSSTIIAPGTVSEDVPPLRAIQKALRSPDPLLDWTVACRMARQGRRLTREQGRIAECFELMHQWHQLAEARSDREALNESAQEMIWILESWDRIDEARRLEYRRSTQYDIQMGLTFE